MWVSKPSGCKRFPSSTKRPDWFRSLVNLAYLWIKVLYSLRKEWGINLTTHLYLVLRLKMSGSVNLFPLLSL